MSVPGAPPITGCIDYSCTPARIQPQYFGFPRRAARLPTNTAAWAILACEFHSATRSPIPTSTSAPRYCPKKARSSSILPARSREIKPDRRALHRRAHLCIAALRTTVLTQKVPSAASACARFWASCALSCARSVSSFSRASVEEKPVLSSRSAGVWLAVDLAIAK